MSSKKKLPINELKPGMISSVDVYFEKKILLAKNSVITEAIINTLKNNYIVNELEVYTDDNYNKNLINKKKTIKEIENTFNEFSFNLENIFSNISMLKVPQLDEIRDFSQKIQKELNLTGIVLKNIVFYGSKDDPIYRHSVNVAAISYILGKWLGLDNNDLNLLSYAAILHDFGKTKINHDIINNMKSGDKLGLSSEEYEIYKTHPILGYKSISEIPYLSSSISSAVLFHHERIDGSGYPLNLKDEKIHKFARIIAIADVFDAASSNRYYREVKGPLDVLKVIQEESFTKLDYKYCNMLLNHTVNFYIGENVILNDERSCKIIKIEMDDLTRPLLLYNSDFLDLKKEKDLYIKELVI